MIIFSKSKKDVENDPFYIVDLEDICNKHSNWLKKLPRVHPFYAVKCNTDMILLKLLAHLGTGFDCASQNEIQKILDMGVDPERIIFANPCKQASYISYAKQMTVDYMTFDNDFELIKIKKHHADAKCVLRIITNDSNAICKFSMKFGADMETSYKLIEQALDLKLNLVGISFHVGSGQMSPEAFSESIENARVLFDYAEQKFNCNMYLLDIGGGFPGSKDSSDLFDLITNEINNSLEKNFPVDLYKNLRIIAEPGRYYACSAFTLCVNIIAKRVMQQSTTDQLETKENFLKNSPHANIFIEETSQTTAYDLNAVDLTKSIMYYINDGVYASFNCLFYDHAECFPILVKPNDKKDDKIYKTSIWGPTCDGLDLVVKECFLPELHSGEYLIFKDMGAYTISGAVAFNGLPLAKCIYSVSTSWNEVKQALTEFFDGQVIDAFDSKKVSNGVSLAFPSFFNTKQDFEKCRNF